MNVRHVGRRISADSDNYTIYASETLEADDNALLLKVRDIVRAAFDEARFVTLVEKMTAAATGTQIKHPVRAIEVLGKATDLSLNLQENVLTALLQNNDLSRWGVINAITQQANADELDYDTATDLETLGGKVLNWSPAEWNRVAQAA